MSSFLCALCRTAVQFSQNPSEFMCNTGSHEAPKIYLHRFEFESGVWTYFEFQLSWKLLLFCPWFNETSLNPGRFNLPIMIVASRFAVKEQQKSLKSSSVKLAARDVAPRTNGNMQMFNHSRRCNVQEKILRMIISSIYFNIIWPLLPRVPLLFSDFIALGLSMPCISMVDVHHSDFLDAFPELDSNRPGIASLK